MRCYGLTHFCCHFISRCRDIRECGRAPLLESGCSCMGLWTSIPHLIIIVPCCHNTGDLCKMISHPIDNPRSPAKADIRNFLKKSAARRALSELGTNDPKANMRMAESLITITAEQFMKKWNFDPIRFRPMPPGRYIWTPVKSVHRKPKPENSVSVDTIPDVALSTYALEDRLSAHLSPSPIDFCSTSTPTTNYDQRDERLSMLETAQPTVSSLLLTPKKSRTSRTESTTPKTKQCKITDYGRQRKRLHSTSKTEEGEPEVITPRKRLALSPSKL